MDALDSKVFEPYLDASLKCGLTLLQEAKGDQPEVRSVCYGLFSTVAKSSISHLAPYMDILMQNVFKSLDDNLVGDNSLNIEVLIIYVYHYFWHLFKLTFICLKFQEKKYNAFSSDDENDDTKDISLETEDDESNDGDGEKCKEQFIIFCRITYFLFLFF